MDNIKRFEDLLRLTGKDGIEQLIQYYRDSDFYTTWASSSYHCNYKGGLLQHSLNVCNYATRLHKDFNSNVDIISKYHLFPRFSGEPPDRLSQLHRKAGFRCLPGPCRLVHKGRLPEKFFSWHADASEFHFQYSVQRKFRDVHFFPD